MKNYLLKNIDIKLLWFVLLPFFVISVFNNPASDDFDFSFKTRDYTYWGAQVYRYMNEGGRFFSNGLLSFNPLVVKAYWAFKVLPILLLSFFVFSVFYFFRSVFYGWDKKITNRFVLLFFLLYFSQLSEICSAFYWLAGAITYQLPISLILLFFGFFANYLRKKSFNFLVIQFMLLPMILGCNEIVSFLFSIGIVAIGIYMKWHKIHIPGYYYILLSIILIASAFELLAPGNAVRGTTLSGVAHQYDFIHAVLKTGLASLKFFFKWFPLLFIAAFYCYPYFKISNYLDTRLSFLVAYAILFLGFFPGFWTGNNILPERAQNTIYFFFIFSGFYFALTVIHNYFDGYVYDIVGNKKISNLLLVGILLFSFSNSPLYDVYNDLLTLKAYKYNKEMVDRYKTIEEATEKELVLPALTNKPKTIYTEPIMGLTNSKHNWKNLELKEYYHKEIVIKPTDSIFIE